MSEEVTASRAAGPCAVGPGAVGPPAWGRPVPPQGPDGAWAEVGDAEAAEALAQRTVSVVVTHYEQPEQLARTLAALGRQTRPPDEVVVADDGSAAVPRVPPGVRVVRQEDRGFRAAAARNLGVRATTGDLLVLLDADTVPEPGFVAAAVRRVAVLPELVVVGRRRHAALAGAPLDAPVEEVGPRRELSAPAWLDDGWARSRDLRDADETSFRFVISAVVACSRWFFDLVGGFDETFTAYGGEDWEWAHRCRLAGGVLAHEPTAVAWHDGPDAGAEPRTWAPGEEDDRALAETVAVADRVAAPVSGWRGLLRGPADLEVLLEPTLAGRGLVACVDSLLAGLPRARVVATAAQRELLGDDPRLAAEPSHAALAGPRLALRLHRALVAEPAAWQRLARACDGSAAPPAVRLGPAEAPWAELRDLRRDRRAARWGLDAPVARAGDAGGFRSADEVTLAAWLGGWAT